MSIQSNQPTPLPEVNVILQELLKKAHNVLGSHFIGMYLDGSLTSADFDEDSDIDFVVVTDEDISGNLFLTLQAAHEQIAALDSRWAIQLEGSYISRQGLRRYDPDHALHPNIERGSSERLKMAYHNESWATHRYVLRERGITIIGPAPQTLIDPISPNDLRRAMQPLLHNWLMPILNNPNAPYYRGGQSYTVLSLCRILYTLHYGDVVSKRVAAHWAQETLDETWVALIDRAWVGRHNPQLRAEADDVKGMLDFIRFTLERGQKFDSGK